MIGRSRGGQTSKLHVLCNEKGQPLRFILYAGQDHDAKHAMKFIEHIPSLCTFIADKGYDTGVLCKALMEKSVNVCVPCRSTRRVQRPYDKGIYRHRNRIERLFGRLKDARRVATRYDRCASIFIGTVAITMIVKFWPTDASNY